MCNLDNLIVGLPDFLIYITTRAKVAEKIIDYLDAPIKRVAALDVPIPCGNAFEDFVLPNVNDIIKVSRQLAQQ